MAHSFHRSQAHSQDFGRIAEVAPMPNLIEVQKSSYEQFLQIERPAGAARADAGLQEVFTSRVPDQGLRRARPAASS